MEPSKVNIKEGEFIQKSNNQHQSHLQISTQYHKTVTNNDDELSANINQGFQNNGDQAVYNEEEIKGKTDQDCKIIQLQSGEEEQEDVEEEQLYKLEEGCEEEEIDIGKIKRTLFRLAKDNSANIVQKFKETLEQIPKRKTQAKMFMKLDPEKKNLIHHILMNANYPLLIFVLRSYPKQVNASEISYDQNPFLHLALTLSSFPKYKQNCVEMVSALLNNAQISEQIDINLQDRLGRTILHIAAQNGLIPLIIKLLERTDLQQIEDIDGNYPIHYALDFNQYEVLELFLSKYSFEEIDMIDNNFHSLVLHCIYRAQWKSLLIILKDILSKSINNNERCKVIELLNLKDRFSRSTFEIARMQGFLTEFQLITEFFEEQVKKQTQVIDQIEVENLYKRIQEVIIGNNKDNAISKENILKSIIITDQRCITHAGFENYANVIKRVKEKEQQPENAERLMVLIDSDRGILSNSQEFQQTINNIPLLEKQFQLINSSQEASIADILRVHDYNYLCKVVEISEEALKGTNIKVRFDNDTAISKESWHCSLLASGAVIKAVDMVMNGEGKNVFCAVRPPGHHAGVFGSTFTSGKEGQHCSEMTNGFCFINNVAIGAAYLKNMYRSQIKKIAIVDFDVHHGNGTQEIVECLKPKKFITKSHLQFANVEASQIQYRPWLDQNDPQNVLFCSIHILDQVKKGSFYPGTGEEKDNTQPSQIDIYPGGILNIGIQPALCKSSTWRKAFTEKIFPRLQEFKPDFIFVSAGFDAHERDHLHNPGDTKVTEFEYQWVTEKLVALSNKFCKGRLVSVYEGGYSTNSGPLSPLAQSVAFHVRALQFKGSYVEQALKPLSISQKLPLKQSESAKSLLEEEQKELNTNMNEEKIKRQLLKKRRKDFRYNDYNMNLRKRRRLEERGNDDSQRAVIDKGEEISMTSPSQSNMLQQVEDDGNDMLLQIGGSVQEGQIGNLCFANANELQNEEKTLKKQFSEEEAIQLGKQQKYLRYELRKNSQYDMSTEKLLQNDQEVMISLDSDNEKQHQSSLLYQHQLQQKSSQGQY